MIRSLELKVRGSRSQKRLYPLAHKYRPLQLLLLLIHITVGITSFFGFAKRLTSSINPSGVVALHIDESNLDPCCLMILRGK